MPINIGLPRLASYARARHFLYLFASHMVAVTKWVKVTQLGLYALCVLHLWLHMTVRDSSHIFESCILFLPRGDATVSVFLSVCNV